MRCSFERIKSCSHRFRTADLIAAVKSFLFFLRKEKKGEIFRAQCLTSGDFLQVEVVKIGVDKLVGQ